MFLWAKNYKLLDIQQHMQDNQSANWRTISNQLDFCRSNIHEMGHCDPLLYSRQQIIFNFDTVSSL